MYTCIPFLKFHADKVFRLSTGNGQTPVINENTRYFLIFARCTLFLILIKTGKKQ